ncbi:manganese-dependent inorganic pyrophosphatase [Aerococcus sanguinicola]|uniref:manganese-dependent inorganic pyrophosphatase n=1 Tax=unclassified Aerococcus TaxID=2618060 RepID=UPI0008A296EE|nr:MULTISPECIES: manganese-dependent inorganic pyrophosphatase [unclassified Aerococcus]MDK6232642.1 manganese-dependent inorganic pyrophosphatase [Aerococcus sp. UMB10185]MDK6855068.1 manganese-dependent inorganic pyrophosphatase [Aerococcus sp. UMB7533]OFN02531.1 manganese-dependent inorganic pyrophosphatase [Aerococcus sp. HMSC062A02]OHO45674.1 manganese-dependent inorganic pyrophosphatase [Aerococcus sp. HMSC035B07]
MSKILVFGHQNPDTDAITSAITYSHLLNQLGEEAEAIALGDLNPETQFALEHFSVQAPRVVKKVAAETDRVALVDHNEFQQSAEDIREVEIHSVVDHHRIANFETASPLAYTARPVGCTQTVIYGLYQVHGVEVTKEIAGLMLSGLISDTLLLKSPTCTEEDRKLASKLAEIAGINLEDYGLDMLRAGADVSEKSALEIADGDAKSFELNGHSVRIGQVNVVDVNDVLKRKDDMLQVMQKETAEKGYDAFFLVVTNILTNDSEGLLVSNVDLVEHFEKAFTGKIVDSQIALPGLVSRKKQIVPPLTEAFEEA